MFSLQSISKKVFLLSLISLVTLSSCKKDDDDDDSGDTATFTVYQGTTALENNHTFNINTTDDATANLHLSIKNNSSNEISMRVKVTNITNADGSNFVLCVGTSCYNSVSSGSLYPDDVFTIAANGQKVFTLWNKNPGTGTYPMTYTFEVQEVGGTGEKVTLTYSYNPN